jgi:hypothetical protein
MPTEEQLGMLRAEIARQNRPRWRVAVDVGVHPVTFGGMLSGRLPMPPRVFADTCSVLQLQMIRSPAPDEAA